MTEDTRLQPDTAGSAAAAGSRPASGAVAPGAAGAASPASAPLTGEVQESVDPFDYAETIVRDLALHVGSRLRDFRADLAAMHSAVVQLPETMKINALGQNVQDLRERLANLTGMVNHLSRPSEEVARLGQGLSDLAQRLAGVESWITASRQAGASGGLPSLPVPSGGFVEMEQFDRVVDQVHESVMRVVGAVRDLQFDLRDLRTEVRGGERKGTAGTATDGGAAQPPAAQAPADGQRADLARLSGRLDVLESRVAALATPAVPAAPAAAPTTGDAAGVAGLLFGAWGRLAQPTGAEALAAALARVTERLADRLGEVVRMPQPGRGSGLVAVATGRVRGAEQMALLAVEDLCGRSWQRQGMELGCAETVGTGAAPRMAGCRTLLAACALAAQTRPGVRIVPILVYGHGTLDSIPDPTEVEAMGRSLGVPDAAARLVQLTADEQVAGGLTALADFPALLADALA